MPLCTFAPLLHLYKRAEHKRMMGMHEPKPFLFPDDLSFETVLLPRCYQTLFGLDKRVHCPTTASAEESSIILVARDRSDLSTSMDWPPETWERSPYSRAPDSVSARWREAWRLLADRRLTPVNMKVTLRQADKEEFHKCSAARHVCWLKQSGYHSKSEGAKRGFIPQTLWSLSGRWWCFSDKHLWKERQWKQRCQRRAEPQSEPAVNHRKQTGKPDFFFSSFTCGQLLICEFSASV